MFFSYLNFSFNKYTQYSKNNFYIKSGDSVSISIKSLKENNIIDSIYRFKILSYLYSINPIYIKGKYKISSNDTEFHILKSLLMAIYTETITIIEGLNFNEIVNILRKINMLIVVMKNLQILLLLMLYHLKVCAF